MAYRRASFADHVPEHLIDYVGGFPVPPAGKVRPVHALASVMKLVANKEDTRQVFEIVAALAGDSTIEMFRRFVATDYGRRVARGEINLIDILSNREKLRAMPEGSFGRVYLAFMEGEDLTPDGILLAAEEAGQDFRCETQFEEFRRMFLHSQVSHDLWHVLTGYGRDALGELCNLGFTRVQSGNRGFRLIIWMGLLAMKGESFGTPTARAVSQGVEMGRGATWLLTEDIESLLPLPLSEVRRKLNFIEPTVYKSIPDDVKAGLLKPKLGKTQSQRESDGGAPAHA